MAGEEDEAPPVGAEAEEAEDRLSVPARADAAPQRSWLASARASIRAVAERVLLVIAWLALFGGALQVGGPAGLAVAAAALGAFLLVHVRLRWPAGWAGERLAPFSASKLGLALLASFLFVVGDALWLIRTGALRESTEESPLLFAVLAILAFPLVEEFGFRLWMQSPLEGRMGVPLAIAVVALAFAGLHSSELPVSQFLAGCLYGVAIWATGSVWAAVVLHAFQNGLLLLAGSIPVVVSTATTLAADPPAWLTPAPFVAWVVASACGLTWARRLRPWGIRGG
jgi:membrane protease YdiL (CAAX protease family)